MQKFANSKTVDLRKANKIIHEMWYSEKMHRTKKFTKETYRYDPNSGNNWKPDLSSFELYPLTKPTIQIPYRFFKPWLEYKTFIEHTYTVGILDQSDRNCSF